jgi:hypothetical protein
LRASLQALLPALLAGAEPALGALPLLGLLGGLKSFVLAVVHRTASHLLRGQQ